jgi:hypothetical protein
VDVYVGRFGALRWDGEDVIIVPAVSDEEAKQKYPGGRKAPKPYLRFVSQPGSVWGQRWCTRLIREESSREPYIHGSVYMLP